MKIILIRNLVENLTIPRGIFLRLWKNVECKRARLCTLWKSHGVLLDDGFGTLAYKWHVQRKYTKSLGYPLHQDSPDLNSVYGFRIFHWDVFSLSHRRILELDLQSLMKFLNLRYISQPKNPKSKSIW